MNARMFAPILLGFAASALAACGGAGQEAVYPARPPAGEGEPIVDPAPSRIVVHAAISRQALKTAMDGAVPKEGNGTFPMLGSERTYTWKRGAIDVGFDQGRVTLSMHVDANADLPVSSLDIPLDVHIKGEPVVTTDYVAKLQSVDVQVTTDSKLVKAADVAADVLPKIKGTLETKLKDFAYDLSPTLTEATERIRRPIDLPLGDASACAFLQVTGVEAGPTVLADGIEKDLAVIVAPSVTLPCSPPDTSNIVLPRLANVATIQPGPFTVTVPIAAQYDELAKAMSLVFKDGKYFFSDTYPKLYLEKPELYAAKDKLVLKLHIAGPVEASGIETSLDGDLFLEGHPAVVDNELKIPDLEPTIETSSFLLKLKAAVDGDKIRDQARAAMRLDLSERLKSVKDKMSNDISFANGEGCMKAAVHKIEITGVHVHKSYLRLYVAATAQASVYMPCP